MNVEQFILKRKAKAEKNAEKTLSYARIVHEFWMKYTELFQAYLDERVERTSLTGWGWTDLHLYITADSIETFVQDLRAFRRLLGKEWRYSKCHSSEETQNAGRIFAFVPKDAAFPEVDQYLYYPILHVEMVPGQKCQRVKVDEKTIVKPIYRIVCE